MCVVQLTADDASTFEKFAAPGVDELPAARVFGFGHSAWTEAELQTAGIAAAPVALPGHVCASAKPWL